MRIDTSHLRRCLWLLVFLAGAGGFIALGIVQIKDYLNFNTNINVNIVDVSQQGGGLQFPSVTVWNVNTVRKSTVVDTPYFDEVCSIEAGIVGDRNEGFQPYPLNWTDDMMFSAAHQFNSMLVGCTFNGANCSTADFFTSLTPFPDNRFGVAHTFNIFSNMTTYIPGPDGGLFLALSIEQDEYCPRTWGSGIFFELHNHHGLEVPIAVEHIMASNRQMLSNGRWWQVAITPTFQFFLGPPYNEPCIDLAAGQLIPRKNESLKCALTCPGVNAFPVLALEKFDRQRFLDISNDTECILNCFNLTLYQLCAPTQFEVELGQLAFPVENAIPPLMIRWPQLALGFNPFNITNDPVALQQVLNNFQNNLVVVYFYFKDLSAVQQQVQTKAYTLGALISNIGGLSGLFLGMSVITLIEAAEILTLLGLFYWHDYSTSHPHQQRPAGSARLTPSTRSAGDKDRNRDLII